MYGTYTVHTAHELLRYLVNSNAPYSTYFTSPFYDDLILILLLRPPASEWDPHEEPVEDLDQRAEAEPDAETQEAANLR